MKEYDFAIVGAGAAGIAAAGAIAKSFPDKSCILIERDSRPGGILLQCIHSGFGLQYFSQELTGPEYARIAYDKITTTKNAKLQIELNTSVIKINQNKTILCSNHKQLQTFGFDKLILATGSREIPFGALSIPSQRPAGIFGAGEAQLLINRHAIKPGRVGVILGAGDIGLIMARRLTYEGMKVAAVVELKSEPGGVRRNVQTCIDDLGIELLTSSTIVRIHGKGRVEGLTIARVDDNLQPMFSESRFVACDFVLSAVGLMPEIQLAREAGAKTDGGHLALEQNGKSSLPWLYACGNAARIYPIVDEVSLTSEETVKNLLKRSDQRSL